MSTDELLLPDEKTVGTAEEYRRRKATSVLAIVFTDIVGSTQLREVLGEVKYEEVRETFEQQFVDVICREDAGVVVKGTGDGALSVFAEPSTAVQRSLEVQDSLRHHPQIKLRIGIDMGQVSVKSSFGIVADVFGRHVNRAARIEALAAPGHILTSFHVYDCAMGWLRGEGIGWHNHGAVVLKGFDNDISIHEIYDPRQSLPQTDQGFPRRGRVLFSRAAARPTRLIKLDQVKWNALYEDLKSHPLEVHRRSLTELKDPLSSYKNMIAGAVDLLVQHVPERPSILWVDDHPDKNGQEQDLLREAGCRIDLAKSTEEAKGELAKNRYFLIITDMSRDQDATAGLDLMRWRRTQRTAAPIFLYTSPSVIARFGEQANAEGCALCTAGVVSLLDGVHQLLREYERRIPVEFLEEEPTPVLAADKAGVRSWASRLHRLFRL